MDKEELVYICMYLIQTFSENNNKRGNTLQLFFYKVNGFPGGSEVKGSASYTEDLGSIPGLGRSLGSGHGNPLQYSCLGNLWTEELGRVQPIGLQKV